VLIKNGRVAITMTGVRTDLTLAYFNQKTFRDNSNSNEESSDGVSIDASRTLSKGSSLSANISRQETETTQKNILTDTIISYNRQQSKKITWSAEIRNTKQKSNVILNESEQNSINLRGTFSF
jgi:outer membrane usher protein FimD/PapC